MEFCVFFFKQKTAYELRSSDWSSDVCSSDLLSFYVNNTAYPYWGGGTFEARSLRANDAMYYALMCHARSRGCTRFDFGRSKVGTGAAAFKKNWGFDPEPLAYAVRTADGAAKREINPLSPRYRLQEIGRAPGRESVGTYV